MQDRQIDTAAKMLARGLPRRQALELLARSAVGGAAVLVTGPEVKAQPGCRREGHPCEGNQTCCAGLTCASREHGSAKRCTAGSDNACEGDCPDTEPAVVVVGMDIDIEVDCAYSGEMRSTSCTFTAAAGGGAVASVIVPDAVLCAEVTGGDFEEVTLSAAAGSSNSDKGLKSTRAENATAVVTVELDGEVTTTATATYWCETDRAGLIPVTGPGLRCAESAETPVANVSDSSGAVVVHTYACDLVSPDADTAWFDVCAVMTTQATFQLTRVDGEAATDVETQSTDAGISRFEQLSPGTYRLEQIDSDWCHAESDSVNEQGDVIVEAGTMATVWVFHCAATP